MSIASGQLHWVIAGSHPKPSGYEVLSTLQCRIVGAMFTGPLLASLAGDEPWCAWDIDVRLYGKPQRGEVPISMT
jgi:hypothetical protein